MRIHDTLSRSARDLETREPGVVTMYVCGPTVQGSPHVGHGRQMVAFDVIRRFLESEGWEVRHVTNVTDIDDKIIAAAAEQDRSTEDVALESAEEFFSGARRLGTKDPTTVCYATASIDAMHDIITRLIERGHAYVAGGDVYFSVRSFEGYGKLSGRDVDEMRAGTRIEPEPLKRDPADFALWKAAKPGEPKWSSPWGEGRPGWHIECSAMAERELGFGFDIHGGGIDLVFPHHENEIAQSEAAAGAEPFARYWLHNGLVNLGGEKMSKSVGNVVGLHDMIDRFGPVAVRYFYLRTHYRSPIEFSDETLADAAAAVDRIRSFLRRAGTTEDAPDAEVVERFRSAMLDDFSTPEALAAVFEAVREGNRLLDSGEDAGPIAAAVGHIMGVLGLVFEERSEGRVTGALGEIAAELGVGVDDEADAVIDALVAARDAARTDRDWPLADRLRDVLAAEGIVVEDGADGSRWYRD